MVARVNVPGIGPMSFPESMSDADIRAQIDRLSTSTQAFANVPSGRTTANQSLDPSARELLDTIAGTEAPDYNTLYGGRKIHDLSWHPGVDVPIMSGPNKGKTSSAFGRYQFLEPTWNAQARKLGLKDMSPESQDLAAFDLAATTYSNKTGRNLLQDWSSGNPNVRRNILNSLSGVWTSLPGGIEQARKYGANAAPQRDELQFDPKAMPLSYLLKGGFERGMEGTFATLTDLLPALGGALVGETDYAKAQLQEYADKMAAVEQDFPTAYKSFKDIDSLKDGLGYFTENLGEITPDMLGYFVGTGIGSMLGKGIAKRAVRSEIEEHAAEYAAKRGLDDAAKATYAETLFDRAAQGAAVKSAFEKGADLGSKLGMGTMAAGLNIPDTFQHIYEETGEIRPGLSIVAGSLVAALDTYLPNKVLKQLGPAGKKELAAKMIDESTVVPTPWKKTFGKELLKTTAGEGLTEGAQQAVQELASEIAGGKNDFFSQDNIDNIIDASIRGALGGGAYGLPGAAVEGVRRKGEESRQIQERQDAKEQAEYEAQIAEEQRQQMIAARSAAGPEAQLDMFPEELEAERQYAASLPRLPQLPADERRAQAEARRAQMEAGMQPPSPIQMGLPGEFSPYEETATPVTTGGRALVTPEQQAAYEAKKGAIERRRQEGLLTEQDTAYPTYHPSRPYSQQRGEPTQLDMFPAEKAAAEGAARRGISPYAQPTAEEITPAEAQFDPVISPDRLKSAGLTPQSGFFKQLAGKDLSKPKDRKVVEGIIDRVQKNPKLAQSTKDGVRSLYTQAMAMYGKQGEMFTPTGRVKKGVSGARVPTRVVGGGGGAGVQVPSGPEGAAPAGGAGIPEQAGMATSEPVATGSQRGEAAQPGALAPEFALPNIPPAQVGEPSKSIEQKRDAWIDYRTKLNKALRNKEISYEDWSDLFSKANAATRQILSIKNSPEHIAAAETADSLDFAKRTADRGRGEVIWSEGPLHLVKTHKNNGDTWYKAVKGRNESKFLEDVDPYDPNSKFTLEDSMKLNAAKDAHEAEDAERHARDPFVKFGIDGLAFSDSIPNEVRSIISEWKRMLNINSNVYIGTFEDARRDYKNFTGPHKAIGGIYQGKASGITRRMDDGSRLVLMEPERSTIANLETLAHELGHIHEKEMFNNAPQATRDAIRKDFDTWYANRKGKSAREFINSLRARKSALLTIAQTDRKGEFPAENMLRYEDYFSSFAEWYADQVARWATTSEKPVSVVEKYFKRLADAIKRFFSQLQNAGYLPSNAVKKYLDSIAEDATNNPPLLDDPDLQGTDIQEMSRKVEERKGAKPIDFSSPNGPFQTVKGMDRFINSTPVFGESQKGILSDAINGASDTARSAILGFLPTHALSDLASRYFPPGVAEAYHAGLRSLDGYLHKLTEKSVDVVMHKYRNARRVSAKQNDLFNKVVNQSTIYEVDPSDPRSISNATKFSMGYVLFNPDGTERGKEIKYFDTAEQRSAAIKAYNQNKPDHEKAFVVKDPDVGTKEAAQRITAMYRRLRPEWKDLYKAMRNSNSEMLKTFKDSLCERIDEASNLDEEARIVFKKSILTRLAEAGMIHPYFTLGREGNHWLAAEVPNQYGAYESFVTAFQDTLSRSKMETELRNSVYKHELKNNLERGMGRQEAQQAAYDTALQNVRIYSNAQEIDYRRMPAGSVINDILGVIEKRKPGRTQGESDEDYRDRVQRFDEVEKDIMQMVINSLPETAFVKSLQKRKKTAGYSEDAVNVYERKTRSTARQISNLRFKPKVNASIDAMRKYADLLGRGQEEVKDPNTGEILQERVVPRDNKVQVDFLNEFTKHSNAAFNPSERFISSTIRSALFGGTLGFNVSSGLIALSNLPMIVFPYLGSEYGTSSTTKAMAEAYRVVKDSGNYRKATSFGSENASDVREEKMASGWSFGNYSPTSKEGRKYATLLEIASAAGQLNRSQLYENLMGSARTTSLDKFNAMSGWMLHTAERFNREVTLIAAYDLELAKLKKEGITGQEAEIRAANKAVYAAEMANGSIAQSSAPRFAQSGLGSIVYMYKRFGATQYYLQAKTLYDSLKGEQDPKVRKMLTNRFWSLTGATAVMSGLQGLPMFGFAAMLYNLFKDDDDDDFNTVARKGLNELFYNGPIEYLTGLSVANRMGLSNLIIKEPRSSGESSSFSQTLLDSFGGPLPSMVDRFNRGIDKIQKGNIERGIEDLMPVAAANAMKATRYLIQGEARTLRGDTIYDDIGPGSAMATLFGFTPSEVARRMEFNAKEKGLSKAIQAKDSNIKGRYYKAWREHDAEGMRDAKRMLVELGAKHPDLGYNAGTVGQIMQDTVKLHEAHTKRMLMGQEYPKKHLRSVHQSMKDLDIEP